MNSSDFVSFLCPKCRTEIEATSDLVGTETECPACGERIVVPSVTPLSDGVIRHGVDEERQERAGAMKSRTIRIELGDDI